jgi:hypothetical protein
MGKVNKKCVKHDEGKTNESDMKRDRSEREKIREL